MRQFAATEDANPSFGFVMWKCTWSQVFMLSSHFLHLKYILKVLPPRLQLYRVNFVIALIIYQLYSNHVNQSWSLSRRPPPPPPPSSSQGIRIEEVLKATKYFCSSIIVKEIDIWQFVISSVKLLFSCTNSCLHHGEKRLCSFPISTRPLSNSQSSSIDTFIPFTIFLKPWSHHSPFSTYILYASLASCLQLRHLISSSFRALLELLRYCDISWRRV